MTTEHKLVTLKSTISAHRKESSPGGRKKFLPMKIKNAAPPSPLLLSHEETAIRRNRPVHFPSRAGTRSRMGETEFMKNGLREDIRAAQKAKAIKASAALEKRQAAIRQLKRFRVIGSLNELRVYLIGRLEIGDYDPGKALHKFNRSLMRTSRCDAFDDKVCHLNWEIYLSRSTKHQPPRMIQSRMAVSAARHATLLTLYGASGLGKTTAAVRAIVFRCMVCRGHSSLAVSGMRLSRMSTSERTDLVGELADFDGSILLDDIDKGSKAEGVSSAFLEIIESRENKSEFLTILTTNSTGRQLTKKLFDGYGDPIVNRIARGICINFDPSDVNETEELSQIRKSLAERNPDLSGERLGDGWIP